MRPRREPRDRGTRDGVARRPLRALAGLARAGGAERFVWAVVTDADLVAAAASDGGEERAADVARTEAPTIEPSAALADAARTMAEHGVTHLIVVEPESERPVGVVSSSDIVRSLALGGS